jgi:phenylacetate-CoA ligase
MYSSLLYTSSPIWLQESLIAAQCLGRNLLREGSRFRRALADIQRTQWLTKQELEDYQLRRLTEIVRHASLHVPFYRDLFAVHGIAVDSLRSLADFTRLPTLTKRQVIDAGDTMLAENFRGLKFKAHTSGTTGTFLRGYRDITSMSRENAFLWRHLLWAGLRRGDRRAWLRGDMIVPLNQGRPPFWRYNRGGKNLIFSGLHLSEGKADA